MLGLLMLLSIASVWWGPGVASAHSTSAGSAMLPAVTTSCPPTLQQGSSGTWVKALQFRINIVATADLGSSTHLSTDGSFGPQTKSAVQEIQVAYGGIDTNGIVGPQTWSVLGVCNQGLPPFGGAFAGNIYSCPPTLSRGSNSIWVNFLQHHLNTLSTWGNFPLNPLLATDGDFGSHTFDAVQAFQRFNLLQSTNGVVGPETWAALSMC
ncbi:MAG TPA: peptidoglycan-binding protein [Ktedonobacteraceae bacterium]|nr:peptidoglycan-binding protein [Ktedonobacteraceae bacterium]